MEIQFRKLEKQIDFLIYEDGATGARITQNKSTYFDSFNLSSESAALLAAYFNYVIVASEKDLKSGSMTDSDLDSLFK